eukprot:CAMPEP_0176490880 /NCGR_PEP_ID=MMETSP0200_2-20121128/8119_1 /TAXON_ID=947934 /ORGANISM="Chaetoceros sp., Strain GSL56" /LENGTH=539 /DNA_ID=CAMNT_0017888241 /DNA_START=113 /DNA_END=1732 /DNA_ORIENTATION=-
MLLIGIFMGYIFIPYFLKGSLTSNNLSDTVPLNSSPTRMGDNVTTKSVHDNVSAPASHDANQQSIRGSVMQPNSNMRKRPSTNVQQTGNVEQIEPQPPSDSFEEGPQNSREDDQIQREASEEEALDNNNNNNNGGGGGEQPKGSIDNSSKLDQSFTQDNNYKSQIALISKAIISEQSSYFSSQSIPTSTTPYIMKTPKLPDGKRLKIMVTGGAGFVGSHLVDKLMQEGHEVIVIDNFFTGQMKNIEHWLKHPNFSLHVHDVTEPIMLEVDQIYHLACPASPPHYQYNPVKTIKTSAMGTLNMLGLAKRVKARMLLTSTSEIYGDPQEHPQVESYWGNVNTIGPRSCYDEGKRVAETMMYSYQKQNNVEVRVARIFNTFGPRMHPNDGRVVSNFIIQALQNKPLTIYGDGSQTRSFQYVSDLVEGLYALMNGSYDLPTNIGNPQEYTVKEFAEFIRNITGSQSEIMFLEKTQDDPTKRRPSIEVAKEKIGWEPRVSVMDGLEKAISYFTTVLDSDGEIITTGPGAAKPKGGEVGVVGKTN